MTLGLVTSSSCKSFRRCPRYYRHRYVDGVTGASRVASLALGTAVHAGLEEWLRSLDLAAAIRAACEKIADPYERAYIGALLTAYDARWRSEELEVLAVEVEFRGPLVNPATGAASKTWQRAGKIDAIVRDPQGLVWVLEHKCLAADAKIYDHSTGRYETIEQLHAECRGPLVWGLTLGNRIVVAQANPPTLAGVREIVEVRTLGGRTLRVSGNHPCWTQRGWVRADELETCDWLAAPRHLTTHRADAPVSDEAIRLVGYMIGDGALGKMSFCKTDPAVLDDVVRCATAVGEKVVVKPHVDRAPTVDFSHVGPVAAAMRLAGMTSATRSATKRLPMHLGLSDRQLGQLVGALWSTDGCIDRHGKKLRIIYTSVSRELCVDLQHVLQRLGIVSNVRTTSVEYKGERRPVSTTQVVSRASKRRFLSLAVEGVIPVLRSAVPLETAATLIPTAPQGDDARMQPELSDVIWWDRIESIDHCPPEATYDLEVPGLHTFVVDGVVTHNTSSEDITPGGDYWKRLRLEGQASDYLVGARMLGFEPAGVLYDVIGKPRVAVRLATPEAERRWTKDGKLYANQRADDESPAEYSARILAKLAEEPDRYLVRGVVARSEEDERDAAFDVWATAKMIRDCELHDRWARNPQSCVMYGRTCDFFAACSREASIDDPILFRREPPHRELSIATKNPVVEEIPACSP